MVELIPPLSICDSHKSAMRCLGGRIATTNLFSPGIPGTERLSLCGPRPGFTCLRGPRRPGSVSRPGRRRRCRSKDRRFDFCYCALRARRASSGRGQHLHRFLLAGHAGVGGCGRLRCKAPDPGRHVPPECQYTSTI